MFRPGCSLLLVIATVTLACSETPRPKSAAASDRSQTADEPSPPPAQEKTSDSSEPESRSPGTGQCDPGCQKLVEKAETLYRQAEALKAGSSAKTALYERAGQAAINAWRGCDLVQPRGQDLGCRGAGALTSTMAKAFLGAERDDRALYAFLVALDPRFRTESSEASSRAGAELERLAEQAENRAKSQPKAPGAAAGLSAAAYARLALGDGEQAGRDAQLLRQAFARKASEEVSLLTAALATHHADQDSWEKALAAVPRASEPAGNLAPRVKILWHAARGRALAGLGQSGTAAEEFRQVLTLWHPPAPKESAKLLGHIEPAPMPGREQVVDAVGAAHFFFGEQQRLTAEKLEMPRYSGPASGNAVSQYVKGPVAEWIAKKQKFITEAEARYRAIVEIKPVPPPRWLVAGLAMTGQAYAEFADDFAQAKLPEAVERKQELRTAFAKALTEAEQPLRAKAAKSRESCQSTAERLGLREEERAVCNSRANQAQ
jgi:hypothetical protein